MTNPLARMIGKSPTSQDQLRAMRAAAWHRQGVVVIRLDEIANDFDRQHVINIASRLYGNRNSNGSNSQKDAPK